MPLALSNPQKRYLRGLAHELKPVLLVGAKGVTAPLVAEGGCTLGPRAGVAENAGSAWVTG